MTDKKKIAFTGSAGFLGQALYKAFENDYELRLSDIADFETDHEKIIGDVTDLDFCKQLVRGMDLLVVAHMLPRPYGDDPSQAYQVNVTGTANLFHAAAQEGIQRACLISSTAVTGTPDPYSVKQGAPPEGWDLYSSTKACQEIIAQACHNEFGMEVAALRIGYVVDCETMLNKYGNRFEHYKCGMVDRHDTGIVARKFLELPELGYKAMSVMSFSEPRDYPAGMETFELLNWRSRFDPSIAESQNNAVAIS